MFWQNMTNEAIYNFATFEVCSNNSHQNRAAQYTRTFNLRHVRFSNQMIQLWPMMLSFVGAKLAKCMSEQIGAATEVLSGENYRTVWR